MKNYSVSNPVPWYIVAGLFLLLILGFVFQLTLPKRGYVDKGHIDSLQQENVTLKNMLAAEMAADNDSMTVEQRLKWSELEKYFADTYSARITEENEVGQWKTAEENKADKQKETVDNKNLLLYLEAKTKALKDLEKEFPKEFAAYAVFIFKYDHYNPNELFRQNKNGDNLYKEKQRIEKTSPIAEYISSDVEARRIKDEEEKNTASICEQKKTEIDKAYQKKINSIDEKYKQKIREKKRLLGL